MSVSKVSQARQIYLEAAALVELEVGWRQQDFEVGERILSLINLQATMPHLLEPHCCAPVAQRLEQQTHNLLVRGSDPCGGTTDIADLRF